MDRLQDSPQHAQNQQAQDSSSEGSFLTPPAFHLTADGPGDGTIQKQEAPSSESTTSETLGSRLRAQVRANAELGAIQASIQAATRPERTRALADLSLRSTLAGAMNYHGFSRCMELLGLQAPDRRQIMYNSEIRASFQRAWNESSPAFRDGPETVEQGGWIVYDLVRDHLFCLRSTSTTVSSVSLRNPPRRPNCTLVGTFHTHPSREQQDGSPWGLGPSDVDIDGASQTRMIPGFVLIWGPQSPGTYLINFTGPSRRPNLTNQTYPPDPNPLPLADPWAEE